MAKYIVTFESSEKVYVGSACENLDLRLKWHITNKTSQVYKNRRYIPKIELLVKAPSRDRKTLEKVENEYIHEYATKYGDKLLNIKSNPNLKRKELKLKVSMENETLICWIGEELFSILLYKFYH